VIRNARALKRWILTTVGAATLALSLTGCGSSPSGGPATSQHVSTSTSTTFEPAGPVYQVRTGTVGGLGKVLIDGQNMTLYLFVPDNRSGKSTCYGTCAQAWPPLLLPAGTKEPIEGAGIDSSLLGTTRRNNGTTQITYDKWPLYLWVGDTQPGEATGQGINNQGGLWYVLAPDGAEITAHA
jgi:predicted lipoprotein with Yx(FWY)xxD motif